MKTGHFVLRGRKKLLKNILGSESRYSARDEFLSEELQISSREAEEIYEEKFDDVIEE